MGLKLKLKGVVGGLVKVRWAIKNMVDSRGGKPIVIMEAALCIGMRRGSWIERPSSRKGEKEERWEESSLAKFSHFLGFSTEGLEKEILDFLIKIRKRRERIHDKVLLEKSKFDRELKRLECSVNYEKGRKQKDPPKGKGCHLSVLQ
ncbi:hypothetical protein AAG906_022441 [Vitis piasezkii]